MLILWLAERLATSARYQLDPMKNPLLLFLVTCLSGCAVYVPTVPSTPLLRNKGEVEVTAGMRSLSSFEAGVAWSPAGRLLVSGEAALQASKITETRNNVSSDYYNRHRQAALGLGTYRLLGRQQSTYLAAMGGIGLARATVYDAHFESFLFPIFGVPAIATYKARYQRYYGQLYVAELKERASYGFSVRGTFVDYSKLQRDNEAVMPSSHFYLEPTWFLRLGKGPIQAQGTVGFSVPLGADLESPDRRNLTPTSMLVSAGVVVRPQLFRRRSASTAE